MRASNSTRRVYRHEKRKTGRAGDLGCDQFIIVCRAGRSPRHRLRGKRGIAEGQGRDGLVGETSISIVMEAVLDEILFAAVQPTDGQCSSAIAGRICNRVILLGAGIADTAVCGVNASAKNRGHAPADSFWSLECRNRRPLVEQDSVVSAGSGERDATDLGAGVVKRNARGTGSGFFSVKTLKWIGAG